jgi:predicted transcriptional regulator
MAEPLVFDSLVYQVRKRACGRERPSARTIPFFCRPAESAGTVSRADASALAFVWRSS